MFRKFALRDSRSLLLVVTIAGASVLSGCDKAPSSSVSATPPAVVSSEQDLKAREAEIAQREAAVAAKERELQVAQREAAVAAAEQDLEKKKQDEAAAAAAKIAAEKKAAAAKAATAKAAAAKAAASATPVKSPGSSASVAPAAPVVRQVQVPGGTAITFALSSDLSSKTAMPGDPFEGTVASSVMVNGRTAIPVGTRVTGKVTEVISGSRAIGATPALGLQFDQLEFEDGQIVPITGELNEQGKSEKVQDSAKILGGVAAGAVLGHQVKTNNRGKVVGGLLGGAIGALVARNTGAEVQLAAGSQLTLNTAEPFTVKVRAD